MVTDGSSSVVSCLICVVVVVVPGFSPALSTSMKMLAETSSYTSQSEMTSIETRPGCWDILTGTKDGLTYHRSTVSVGSMFASTNTVN